MTWSPEDEDRKTALAEPSSPSRYVPLVEGEPCPACQKIVRYPLSHVCDARKIDASIVNDLDDYIVCLGGEKYRMPRAVFVSLIRGHSSEIATPTEAMINAAMCVHLDMVNASIRKQPTDLWPDHYKRVYLAMRGAK